MRNTFKLSTFVLKLALFAFIMSSFTLVSVKAKGTSENDKMINQHVRLSLWYVGLEQKSASKAGIQQQSQIPEELGVALEKLERSKVTP